MHPLAEMVQQHINDMEHGNKVIQKWCGYRITIAVLRYAILSKFGYNEL